MSAKYRIVSFCRGLGLAVLAATLAPATAAAQAYPAKPIELVVHTSAGGGGDLFARTVSTAGSRPRAPSGVNLS